MSRADLTSGTGRVLVTGATGFVGGHLCALLARSGFDVVGAARRSLPTKNGGDFPVVPVGDIGADVDWEPLLAGVDYVVHLASRVHVMYEQENEPLEAFRRVNVFGTERLLAALSPGQLKRFVYVSTVKVFGESGANSAICAHDEPDPQDPYSVSKHEAEIEVEKVARKISCPYTIIRPPLVYGPGVGGNFLRLLKLVDRGVPLPLGSVRNARSMVNVQNLCDLIRECLTNEAAAGKKLLVSDNTDVSTGNLVLKLAAAMSRQSRVFPFSPRLLRLAGSLLGRRAEIDRLVESLTVDISETKDALDWTPPVSLDRGVAHTVDWYLASR